MKDTQSAKFRWVIFRCIRYVARARYFLGDYGEIGRPDPVFVQDLTSSLSARDNAVTLTIMHDARRSWHVC
jgi:hypothetical protein